MTYISSGGGRDHKHGKGNHDVYSSSPDDEPRYGHHKYPSGKAKSKHRGRQRGREHGCSRNSEGANSSSSLSSPYWADKGNKEWGRGELSWGSHASSQPWLADPSRPRSSPTLGSGAQHHHYQTPLASYYGGGPYSQPPDIPTEAGSEALSHGYGSRGATYSDSSAAGSRRLTPGSSGHNSPTVHAAGGPEAFDTATYTPSAGYYTGQVSSLSEQNSSGAADFWRWDVQRQQWVHTEPDGSILTCPDELD